MPKFKGIKVRHDQPKHPSLRIFLPQIGYELYPDKELWESETEKCEYISNPEGSNRYEVMGSICGEKGFRRVGSVVLCYRHEILAARVKGSNAVVFADWEKVQRTMKPTWARWIQVTAERERVIEELMKTQGKGAEASRPKG